MKLQEKAHISIYLVNQVAVTLLENSKKSSYIARVPRKITKTDKFSVIILVFFILRGHVDRRDGFSGLKEL